jgi:hypothetical protein
MIKKTTSICCDQEPDCEDSQGSWLLITVYVKETSRKGLYFITKENDLAQRYIDVVKPFIVGKFHHDTYDQAEKFAKKFLSYSRKIDHRAVVFSVNEAKATSY